MRVFLASIPLDGRNVAVIGGGEQAIAKVRLMARTPAKVLWFTPDGAPPEAERPQGVDAPLARAPSLLDLEGAALVFIALADADQAQAIADRARRAGALVNLVDRPALSDFHTPALVDRGEVVVAVATGGSAPILARDVRARVEAVLPPGLDLLATLAREVRDTVKAAIPDFLARRRFWEKALRGRTADLAAKGQASEARREILRHLNSDEAPRGVVHIVGAGPGDPELLTLKALRVLQDADVIVHDRLVSDAVLDYARRDARRIYVGKARSDHSVPQRDIEAVLIEEARAGHRVVRLKGGDPFVFGRGGEELQALREADVAVEVVPGISAAVGCAASAGIPLTHRDHAQAATLMTGQAKPGAPDPDWGGLSAPENTLAVYMGVGTAGKIVRSLLAAGRDPATPVAVVENGTLPSERVLKGALHELELLIEAFAVSGPAILYIGETAAFARGESLAEVRAQEVAA
jgi:uroporphyrin-III C-methyltransferase/precorrin-2 dehydrogenase/sirohydrochlorin ferrochelatase